MIGSRLFRWPLPCLVLAAAPCTAQESVVPGPGTRLRVTAPTLASKPIVGTLVESTEDAIRLSASRSDQRLIPRTAITRLEWSRGHHGNAVKGLLIGAAIGAVVVAVGGCEGETCTAGDYLMFTAVGAGLGALPGAGAGALVKTERWTELPLANPRVTVAPLPNQGVGVRVAWTW